MNELLKKEVDFYQAEIQQYDKVQTKKRMLSKWLKEVEEHLSELNDNLMGYLYGELVTYKDIRDAEREAIAIKYVYNNLSK